MITRIIFTQNLNCKPSEDSGLRSSMIGSFTPNREVYYLPGILNKPMSSMKGSNGIKRMPIINTSEVKKTRSKPLILHVEDNTEIRFLVSVLLRKEFDIHSVESGEKAIEMLNKNDYDIILMDLNLGSGISGIEATSKIRKDERMRTIPIIAVTANNFHEVREDCIEVGMNAFIQKPFDKADLIETIHELSIN